MDRRSDETLRKRRLWRRSAESIDGDVQRRTGVRGWFRREIGDFFHPESRGERDRDKMEPPILSPDNPAVEDSYAAVDVLFESCGDLR